MSARTPAIESVRFTSACRRRRSRRGSLLLDTCGGLMIMAIVMSLTTQLLVWTGEERVAAGRRVWATQEAINILERVRAVPPERLDEAIEAASQLGERTARLLPDGRLDLTATEPGGSPPARRVTVTIRWSGRGDAPIAPVRLTTWVHSSSPPTEAAP